MRLFILAIAAILFVGGCSKEPQYIWKAQAGEYFLQYQNMMLDDNDEQALYYFKQAVNEAKKDTSLATLAHLYLGACAMERALFREVACSAYHDLIALSPQTAKPSYEAFIKADTLSVDTHTKHYEDVIIAIQKASPDEVIKALGDMKSISSQAIAASVAVRKGMESKALADTMIDLASSYNVKGLLKVWLEKKLALLDAQDAEVKALKAHIRLLSIK